MYKQLRFDFYRVVMPVDARWTFERVLNTIGGLEPMRRLDNSGEYPIRLQRLEARDAFLIGDIARIRMNDIPDKMKLNGVTTELQLDEDEGLGEITTFLYHPQTGILVFMRNRNAVSLSAFSTYISNVGNAYHINYNHVLQEEAYRRLERITIMQRIDLEVAAPGNAAIFADLGMSPEAYMDLMGASPRVRMSLSCSTGHDRQRSLPRRAIETIVTAVRRRPIDRETEQVNLIVSGREENLEKEVIDLFEDVLVDTFDVNIRNQRKITDDQRFFGIISVWGRHRDNFIRAFGREDA